MDGPLLCARTTLAGDRDSFEPNPAEFGDSRLRITAVLNQLDAGEHASSSLH